MTDEEILKHVDHTLLKALTSWDGIITLCGEAVKYKTACVCIPPSYVIPVKRDYGDKLKICTVIGFPLGYNKRSVKVFETKEAVKDGADEIDTVIKVGDVPNNDWDGIAGELAEIRKACAGKILKVIIETCYLDEAAKIKLCKIVTDSGADYIKTSTGFGTAGATLADVKLFASHIGPNVKIKAAGGIKTREDMIAFLEAGADRLGTSSAVSILTAGKAGAY